MSITLKKTHDGKYTLVINDNTLGTSITLDKALDIIAEFEKGAMFEPCTR